MIKKSILIGSAVLALVACSETEHAARVADSANVDASSFEGMPADDGPESDRSNISEDRASRITEPQIAYTYDYGFRIAPEEIPTLAQRHIEMCEAVPQKGCRVLSLQQSGGEESYAYGKLQLAVIASRARDFGASLATRTVELGGEQVDAAISGEDLSKQIVDTQARLRARTLLRDRLMDILRTRNGTVAELVEAERGVAQVNEEIDQARSWLSEMRGRVAFSTIAVDYSSSVRSEGSFARPISDAFQSVGPILGKTIASIIYILTVLIPVLSVIFGLIWVWRKNPFNLLRPSKDVALEA